MNRLFSLPDNILSDIYAMDTTYRDKIQNVIKYEIFNNSWVRFRNKFLSQSVFINETIVSRKIQLIFEYLQSRQGGYEYVSLPSDQITITTSWKGITYDNYHISHTEIDYYDSDSDIDTDDQKEYMNLLDEIKDTNILLPVEFASIKHEIDGLNIIITVEVHTIYKTGVEVEAMHGAAVTALTMYDMLKPIDKEVVIKNIALQKKSGGKSDYKKEDFEHLKCAVIVCSDTISKGEKQDTAGKSIIEKLKKIGIETTVYEIIADDIELIQAAVKKYAAAAHQLLIFTGGTGLSIRDVTPDAVEPMLDKLVPGIMETARNYGQQRMPHAMLSRGVAGFVGNTLILTLPGSQKGASETIDAIFPQVLHLFDVKKGKQHY